MKNVILKYSCAAILTLMFGNQYVQANSSCSNKSFTTEYNASGKTFNAFISDSFNQPFLLVCSNDKNVSQQSDQFYAWDIADRDVKDIASEDSLNAQSPERNKRSLQNKEVFTKGFPKTLLFRNDKTGLNEGYDYWEKIHFPFNAITKKYLQEEVDMPPVIAEWANKYADKHPGKLMLVHLNGEGRSVNDEDMQKLYFPGHWMYEEGTFPAENIDKNQKTIGFMNGMETEGLCRWNDGYRQISRTINQHTYWNLYNNTKYQYSYITSKLRNPLDEKIAPQLHRMGLGLTACLGVSYAYSPTFFIPEAFGGALQKANWLGEPLDNMKYAVKENDDLLIGAGVNFDENLLSQFDFTGVEHKLENNTLYIKGKNKNLYEEIVVPGPEVSVPSGDLLIFFEAKAIKGFTDLKNEGRIPRKINVRIEGLPEFPVEPMNTHELYNDLAGFMGTEEFTSQMFYFRNAGNSENALKLIFEAEEQGEFAIRNLKIMNAPCAIIRDFENGVVLVNPSLHPFDFNLDQLLETQQAYQRIKIVPPLVGKLDGNPEEITKYNNGEIVENSSKVTVPALNALFLIKTK